MTDLMEYIDSATAYKVVKKFVADKSVLRKRGFPCKGKPLNKIKKGKGKKNVMENWIKITGSISEPTVRDIYALDCETRTTAEGIELVSVTVVNIFERVELDILVKPDNEVLSFSNDSDITKEILANATHNLASAQAELLLLFKTQTIIVGYDLAKTFCALKLIHGNIIDLSFLYPGHAKSIEELYEKKRKKKILNSLVFENKHNGVKRAIVSMQLLKLFMNTGKRRSLLKKIIQEIEKSEETIIPSAIENIGSEDEDKAIKLLRNFCKSKRQKKLIKEMEDIYVVPRKEDRHRKKVNHHRRRHTE